MAAASNNSPGIDLKNPVRRKIVIGRENVIYGIIRPTLELVNPSPAKRTNSGIRIQCTGTIIPIRKNVCAASDNFQRILAMANAAIAPKNRLTTSVIPQTSTEFTSAIPSLPIVHACW